MSRQSTRRIFGAATMVICLAGGGAMLAPRVSAQFSQADLSSADIVRTALDQQTGKRVRVKLVSGQDLEGQVSRVGTNGVLLTELAGMEFYDATVRLEQIAAVIVRRPR